MVAMLTTFRAGAPIGGPLCLFLVMYMAVGVLVPRMLALWSLTSCLDGCYIVLITTLHPGQRIAPYRDFIGLYQMIQGGT